MKWLIGTVVVIAALFAWGLHSKASFDHRCANRNGHVERVGTYGQVCLSSDGRVLDSR